MNDRTVTLSPEQWYWVLEAMRAKVRGARCARGNGERVRELQLIERLIEGAAQ